METALTEEAIRLVNAAKAAKIEVRILGSVAVCIYVGLQCVNRPAPLKDIDLITRRENRERIQSFLINEGLYLAKELLMFSEIRETYTNPKRRFTIDLYYDKIDGNHPLILRDRIDVSFPMISWTDLLITKLQRRKLRAEDMWDICSLVKECERSIDSQYFERLVGNDWGLHTTMTDNLTKIKEICTTHSNELSFILERATLCRKTWRWVVRSMLGKRTKWWKEMYRTEITES